MAVGRIGKPARAPRGAEHNSAAPAAGGACLRPRSHPPVSSVSSVPASPAVVPRRLLVRLHNWIGDVVVGVPALRLLAAHGVEPVAVGKPWAASLLAGHGWTVRTLDRGLRARARQWHGLALPQPRRDIDVLLFATSLSSALECRLGGLRAMGYDTDLRRLVLARSLPRPHGVHALEETWRLACRYLGVDLPAPASIGLTVAPDRLAAARRRLAAHGVTSGAFVLLCPFALGRFEGQSKAWPGFPALARRLQADGLRTLVCPGPGAEQAAAQVDFATSTVLDGVALGEYAALLSLAALVVANDTGPGHIAAAVGAPLISVLGPTDPARWAPWGPTVHVLQRGRTNWPGVDEVLAQARSMLAGHESDDGGAAGRPQSPASGGGSSDAFR